MSNVFKVSAPKNNIENWIIAGDWHSGYMCFKAFRCLMKYAKTFKEKPNLIINGDFLDAEFLMPKKECYKANMKFKDFEGHFVPKAEEEIEWGNTCLDKLEKVFNRIIFVKGNHDIRYDNFMNVVPHAYKHNFDLVARLKLKERKIDCIGYNDWLDLGEKLTVTHGIYHGATCLKKHYEAGGSKNVVFGHVHSGECKAFNYRGETRKAWSTPALCKLNPVYMKNSPNNWSNGFIEVNLRPDSNFNLHTHEIWQGKLVLQRGEVIEGAVSALN